MANFAVGTDTSVELHAIPLGLSGGSYTVTRAPYYYMGVPSGYYI